MNKRWTIRKHDFDEVRSLAEILGLPPLVAALLISRGYRDEDSARKFLNPHFDDLNDPTLLKGMPEAVARILLAVEKKEKVLIWGDYDVDGTTGTVLLRKVLHRLGAETGFHIPNRFTEGYGINIPALEKAKADGFSLVISVDCGIRSFEPLEWAKEHGLDVIVTDHHLSDPVRGNPPAVAVVNPNQPGCLYPDKDLAGVGVAFKVAQALLREKSDEKLITSFLEIAAIGTVADVMRLTGENRSIVSLGLKELVKTENTGLRALMEVSDCTSEMTSLHIGFRIAPRINAAGRMDVARHVVELLECQDFSEARKLASVLDSRNRERQQMQQKITELALFEADSWTGRHFVVVAGENWHRGVIGLAASKIAEKLYRPTIVLSTENGIGHGSARSIANFHLLNALESCPELFEQFGGHAAAAGMKMKTDNIEALREKLDLHAKSSIAEADLTPELMIDAVVTSQTLSLNLLEDIKKLEPFGSGNPKPVFVTRDLFLRGEPFVMKEKHLKLMLADKTGKRFEAVWWDGVDKSKKQTFPPDTRIEVAYTVEANTWQGNTRLQLVVEDLKSG